MSKTIFSHDLRMLMCAQCGAPIEGAIAGGHISCRFCQAVMVLQPRDETADAAAARAPAISESERYQHLRAQDGKPLVPPPSLHHLFTPSGELPQENIPHALAEFQRARYEVAQSDSFGAAERLYFLTLILYTPLAQARDDAKLRALLETARDLLTDARHRQVIHGMLARNAARAGDLDAAEKWLALCNPRSLDLHMDTAYRFTRAYLSTTRGDFATVLQVLGSRAEDVPIADNQDEICALLRANALERTGRAQEATAQIAALLAPNPAMSEFLSTMIAANGHLQLCPHSFALAVQQSRQMQANAVRTGSGLKVGKIIVTVVIINVVVFGGLTIGNALLPASIASVLLPIVIVASIALVFVAVFGSIFRAQAARRRLLATGAPARARILQVNGTGTRINGEPLMELHLHVQPAGQQPYVAIHREVISTVVLPRLAPGSDIGVRLDPSDPSLMAIEWGR